MANKSDPTPILGGTIPMIPAGDDIEGTIAFYGNLGFEVVFSQGDPIAIACWRCFTNHPPEFAWGRPGRGIPTQTK